MYPIQYFFIMAAMNFYVFQYIDINDKLFSLYILVFLEIFLVYCLNVMMA